MRHMSHERMKKMSLKEKIMKIATSKGENQIDEMIALIAEQGYELEKKTPLEMEELSDDDLEKAVGGLDYEFLCILVLGLFGVAPEECEYPYTHGPMK